MVVLLLLLLLTLPLLALAPLLLTLLIRLVVRLARHVLPGLLPRRPWRRSLIGPAVITHEAAAAPTGQTSQPTKACEPSEAGGEGAA
eukprot:COSAG01_NODE_44829_length_415_cov_0.813291_1_plen_86_part_10